jgi:hypothetical protein
VQSDKSDSTLSEAAELCREVGLDPDKRSPSLDDIKALMLHVARRSGAWRNAGLALVNQLDSSLGNNAEKYCALCFALGLVSAQEPRIGAGLRFAAPLLADELLRSD